MSGSGDAESARDMNEEESEADEAFFSATTKTTTAAAATSNEIAIVDEGTAMEGDGDGDDDNNNTDNNNASRNLQTVDKALESDTVSSQASGMGVKVEMPEVVDEHDTVPPTDNRDANIDIDVHDNLGEEGHENSCIEEEDGGCAMPGVQGVVELDNNNNHEEDDARHENNNNTIPQDDTLDNVSDISDPSVLEEEIVDEWMDTPADGVDRHSELMDNFNVTNRNSNNNNDLPRNRSFTICSVISNTSDHESLRSQRENVDRLLGTGGDRRTGPGSSLGGGSDWGRGGGSGSIHQHSPSAYDQNYYRAGDWLRFVPRRSSLLQSSSGDPPSGPSSLSDGQASYPYAHHHHHNHHHHSPGFVGNPDHYYRGFDNTRIRTGFGYPKTRIRTQDHAHPPHALAHHHFNQMGVAVATAEEGCVNNMNMVGPTGLSLEQQQHNLEVGGGSYVVHHQHYPTHPAGIGHPLHIYPNLIPGTIDEEGGGGGGVGKNDYNNEHITRNVNSSTPPLEIHCASSLEKYDTVNDGDQNLTPSQDFQQQQQKQQQQHREDMVGGASLPQPSPMLRNNSSSPEPVGEGMHFESSLRIGGITCPPSNSRSQTTRSSHLPPHIQEQKMHEASWDSKYATYACRVDKSQEDRSVEIPIFSMARPHMRAFHFAWFAFFFAFLAWFAITPLLAEVQISLDLSHEQLWTSSIAAVSGAVVTRCFAGVFCDIYGARWVFCFFFLQTNSFIKGHQFVTLLPLMYLHNVLLYIRWMSAVVLFICGIPTMFTGLVNTTAGLSALRLVTGIGGSAFVTCQYWTSTMFTKEVAGTANALAAGWGNLGGGVAQIFVGSILFPMFKAIYTAAGKEDPADLSWRTCCIIPGLMCTVFTIFIIKYSDDSPKGNYTKRKHLGLMQKPSAMKHIKAAVRDHNTLLLLIQYGCCFGVELTTSNAAALYFKTEFELSTEAAAAVASTFGWMNLFARGLGGFLSDISNAYRGMRGRLVWQFVCFLLEG